MIWQPDQSLWVPIESRFGPWYRKAKRWRASIVSHMAGDLKADSGTGHLTYKSVGGHLVYCPTPICPQCSGSTPSSVTGTVAGHTFCPGTYTALPGNGGIALYDYVVTGGNFNGTYSFTQNLYGSDSNCFYAIHEYPTSRISGTWVVHGGGSPSSDFSFNINLSTQDGSPPNWKYTIYVFGGNVNASGNAGDPRLLLTGSLTNTGSGNFDCMANFTLNNNAANCSDSLLYGGTLAGSPS